MPTPHQPHQARSDPPDPSAAQARGVLGRELASARLRADLTQTDLAARIEYSRSTVANVETGRQTATADFWTRCDQVLNTGGALSAAARQLATGAAVPLPITALPYAAGYVAAYVTPMTAVAPAAVAAGNRSPGTAAPVLATAGLDLPWTAAGALRAAELVTDPRGMDRRALLITVLGSTLTAPALEWLIARAPDDLASTSGRPLAVQIVDHLDAITDSLRRMDDQLGGAATLALIQAHLDTVTRLAKTRRYDESVGRRLHTAAGELLRLAGWVSFDAGHHAQAQRYWNAGLREAHAAGDIGLGANILGCLSCQAKDLGAYTEAVTLAEAARTKYPGASPRVSAILDLRAAEAYANTGSDTDAARCIDDAFSHLTDPTPAHGDPGWSYWIDAAQAHAQAGYCHLTLQDWQPARAHLRRALDLQGSEVAREGALRTTLLADTYARQPSPDLDLALALGNQAIDTLDGTVDSARCVGHVQRLSQHLNRHRRHPGVRDLTDRADIQASASA